MLGAGGRCFQKNNVEFCRMDSDSDPYFEESSDAADEFAGPLHLNVKINMEE